MLDKVSNKETFFFFVSTLPSLSFDSFEVSLFSGFTSGLSFTFSGSGCGFSSFTSTGSCTGSFEGGC
ncbi:MAG: hypothetical protein MJ252_10505 [archaeon]|nr:hypothetical protein [archaeon]